MPPSSLTRFSGRRSDRCVINWQSRGVLLSGAQLLVLGEQRPGDARVLVGDSDQGSVVAASLLQLKGPARQMILMSVRALQHRACALHEKVAQVSITALADVSKAGLAPGGVLARYQADPRRELPAVLELACITDRATIAKAVVGPMPRIFISRRAGSDSRACASICRS